MDLMTALHILNLDDDASPAEARRAYRTLARLYHPDRMRCHPRLSADAGDRMVQINLAYRFLVPLLEDRMSRRSSSEPVPSRPGVSDFEPDVDKGRNSVWTGLIRILKPFFRPDPAQHSRPGRTSDTDRPPLRTAGRHTEPQKFEGTSFRSVLKSHISSKKAGQGRSNVGGRLRRRVDYRTYAAQRRRIRTASGIRSGDARVEAVGPVTPVSRVSSVGR